MTLLTQLIGDTRFGSLPDDFYRRVQPQPLSNPYLVAFSPAMAELLDIDSDLFQQQGLIDLLSGSQLVEQGNPFAMIYAGHQFGHFVPQLGDGRALTIGEIRGSDKQLWEIQLKGAGLTPFSRMGDGRAVLRSTIREFLCSEAMAALGIPTTRALSITGSQDPVYRETVETAAVLARAAPSHLRFGNFELFFYRQQYAQLKVLADFIIEHYYPQCGDAENPCLELLRIVIDSTAKLVAHWQLVGFTHGVLNTDNMSILGLTIDYGPYGFLDTFESAFVCNHTDQHGRYAYDQQPRVGLFNLSCLAQAMLPVIDEHDGENAAQQAKQLLAGYQPLYTRYYLQGMAAKLGLDELKPADESLFKGLFEAMEMQVDFTNFFRALCQYDMDGDNQRIRDQFIDRSKFDRWEADYRIRIGENSSNAATRQQRMLAINPKYILRNYLVHQAIVKAEQGDFSEVTRLQTALQQPFAEAAEFNDYADEPPDWAKTLDLSCSS